MRVGRLIPPGRYARKMAREMRILVLPHLFDRYELRLLSRVMHPGSVFIDVGANVGIYTVFAALRGGPTSRVFAVEPNPAALERLRCNLSLNGLTNVVVEPIALGEKAGLVSFKLDRRNIGNSSLVFDRDAPAGDLIEVQGQTLMDLCARYGIVRLDAIKLDVEGAEDQILFPFFAEAPASLWPTLLLVENSEGQWRRDCASMLIEKGYRRKRIPSRNLAFWRPAPRP